MISLSALLLTQLAAFAVLTAASLSLGSWVTAPLPLRLPLERFAFATAAGLGGLATALFLLGLAGLLAPLPVAAVAAAAALCGRRTVGGAAAPVAAPPRRRELALAALLVTPALVLSLYPPIGFDATTYHLPTAAALARAGRLELIPEQLFPVFPQLAEVLFAGVLVLATDAAVHTVQYLCLAAVTAAVWAAGERWGGPRAGLLAAALWLANPLVHYQAASAYVDLVMTLFALLAAVAWERWREEERVEWLLACGAFGGLAAATKYQGLIWLGLLGVATLLAGRRRRFASVALLSAAAAATLCPWYLRIIALTRNPLFPLLSQWFPGTGSRWEAVAGPGAGRAWAAGRGFGGTILASTWPPWRLFTLPWRLAFDRAGFSHQSLLSPWYLVVVPLAILFASRDRRLLRWLALVTAYAALGGATDPRFMLPCAALLAIAGGLCGARLLRQAAASPREPGVPPVARAPRAPELWVTLLALALAAPGPLYACYRLARLGPVPTTRPSRDAFLTRELPGYELVRWLNDRCGGSYVLYALGAENLAYYVRGRFLGQVGGPFAQRRVAPLLTEPEQLYAMLSQWGAQYLLLRPREATPPDPHFTARFRSLRVAGDDELFALRPGQAGPKAVRGPGPSSY
jgi:hypothetical protein